MEVTPRPPGIPAASNATTMIAVADPSQVGEARRSAAALSASLGFNDVRAGELAIIVTELANNLVRHGGGGEMLLRTLYPSGGAGGGEGEAPPERSGIEVLALDRGPGILNVNAAMRDGFTTGSTPGTGLGAVRRLSLLFDIASAPGRGTAIVAQVWPGEPPSTLALEIGACCLPLRGERVCGDAWRVIEHAGSGRTTVVVADGLGHGALAAEASQRALAITREHPTVPPKQLMEQLHAGLRPTRGAAVAVAQLDPAASKIRFCGVGNITSFVVGRDGVTKSLLSHNGTVGAEARRIVELEQPWPEGSLLILTSDGITSRWHLSDYPGLILKRPSLIAGTLYRDHLRGRDDATVLVLRDPRPQR